MNDQERAFLKAQEEKMEAEKTQAQATAQGSQLSTAYAQTQLEKEEKGIVKEQLELTEELWKIEQLLRGKILTTNGWIDPPDNEMVILSDYGIHLIMNTISFYINKNTLLSNYETDVINAKMQDFAEALADTIFMEYEKVFQYPSFEDCKKVFEARIDKKVKMKQFAYDLVGKSRDEKEIREETIKQIEDRIEKELETIKEQIIKNKLKRFIILIREVQDAVHSTYLRAWNGAERRTLRQHITVSETMGQNNQLNKPTKSPLSVFRSS